MIIFCVDLKFFFFFVINLDIVLSYDVFSSFHCKKKKKNLKTKTNTGSKGTNSNV